HVTDFPTADATYPARIRHELEKRDFIDPIWAAHFNIQQNEIQATQKTLGVLPQVATRDPADRVNDYGTVANRITKVARAEQMISYVAANTAVTLPTNRWYRVSFETTMADSRGAAYPAGLTIPESGYWVLTAKADWKSDSVSKQKNAVRLVGIEINGEDVGLRRSLIEDEYTSSTPTTRVVWQEALAKGTNISVAVRADIQQPPSNYECEVNVYLRAHLVRCLGRAELNLTTAFERLPEPEPEPKPEPGPKPEIPKPRVEPRPAPSYTPYDPGINIILVNPDHTIYYPDLQGGYYSQPALDKYFSRWESSGGMYPLR